MRITILQGAFFPVPPLRGGAVEKVWMALGGEMARRGHEVTHVSRLCDGLPVSETRHGVRHLRVPGFDAPRSLLRLKFQDLIFTLRVRQRLPLADIVVTNTFWAPCLLSPTRHGAIWVHVQRYPRGQMILYRKAACIQTVSTVIERAILRQAPGLRSRVRLIPNPLPSLVASIGPTIKQPGLILFVGRVHPEKGVELLISAFAHLLHHDPSARLRIVGPWQTEYGGGGTEFLGAMKTLAAPFASALEWVGPVFDERALARHFCEASTFVYPSLAAKGEASPVAPLEALARGLPVVVSDLKCFDDYLQPGTFAFRFNHLSTDAAGELARTLSTALVAAADPQVALDARARASHFSIETVADRYLQGFSEVVGRTGDGR